MRTMLALVVALPIMTAQVFAAGQPSTKNITATAKNGLTFTVAPFNGWVPA